MLEGSGCPLPPPEPGSGLLGWSVLEKRSLWQQHGTLEAAEPDDEDFI